MPNDFDVSNFLIWVLEWSVIPDFDYSVGDDVDIDLWQYLPSQFDGTVTRKIGTDQLPPDLSIVESRYLRGEVTEVSNRDITLVATQGGVSVDSPEFNIVVEDMAYHEWDATITNLETGETLDQFVGHAFESGNGVLFFAKFRVQNTAEWTTVNPRLSLPVAAVGSPEKLVGGGQGYGGSEQKEVKSFGGSATNLGSITSDIAGSYSILTDITIHNNQYYVSFSVEGNYISLGTFNLSTRVFSEYGDYRDSTFDITRFTSIISSGGVLYVWAQRNSPNSHESRLMSVDSTSELTDISTNYSSVDISSMVEVGGVVYGIGDNNTLYSVNLSTGALTSIGTISDTNIHSLVEIDGVLYGADASSPYELYRIRTDTATIEEIYRFAVAPDAMFYENEKLYFFDGLTFYSTEMDTPPLSGLDFEGEDYTTAIAQCVLESSLIEVQIEKLQRGDGDVFINISGSYEK